MQESKDVCGGSGIVDEKILVLEVLWPALKYNLGVTHRIPEKPNLL